jgi:pantoate--beta-alanine ligase
MALVAEARAARDHVVASIFVNPTQFGPNEDLSTYPRREAADAAMLEEAGCAILWAPDAATMYPGGFATSVRSAGSARAGGRRPARPFRRRGDGGGEAVRPGPPDVALFGEKDYQQLAVIRRMARDLDSPSRSSAFRPCATPTASPCPRATPISRRRRVAALPCPEP